MAQLLPHLCFKSSGKKRCPGRLAPLWRGRILPLTTRAHNLDSVGLGPVACAVRVARVGRVRANSARVSFWDSTRSWKSQPSSPYSVGGFPGRSPLQKWRSREYLQDVANLLQTALVTFPCARCTCDLTPRARGGHVRAFAAHPGLFTGPTVTKLVIVPIATNRGSAGDSRSSGNLNLAHSWPCTGCCPSSVCYMT